VDGLETITQPAQRVSLRLDDVRMYFGGVKAIDGVSIIVESGRCMA